MITLHQLRIFVAVAEHGSTAAAADKLFLSQPAISLTIKNLESELGSKLFVRHHPKGLSVNKFGEEKLAEARRLLTQANLFSNKDKEAKSLKGKISLGYFTTLGPFYIPRLMRTLHDQIPGCQITLCEGNLPEINQMLESGKIELALSYDIGLPNDNATVFKLKRCAFYAIVPGNHPLAKSDSVSLEALAKENFIQLELPLSREYLMSPFWQYGLNPRIAYRTTSLENVRGMVANGLGVSLLITRPVTDLAYDGNELKVLSISNPLPTQYLILAQSIHFATTPLLQSVVEEIKSLFQFSEK